VNKLVKKLIIDPNAMRLQWPVLEGKPGTGKSFWLDSFLGNI